MRTLVIASRNRKKTQELERLLKGLKVKIQPLDDVDINVPEIIEDGKTFKQNAIKKAVTISKLLNNLVIADDSGLEVDYLGGRPGVRSSRFAHTKATDEENINKLLRLMKNVPEGKRGAVFVSAIAVADRGELIKCVQGPCRGNIIFEPKGHNGFGYDPLFIPSGYRLTFAQMKPTFKNRISHRAKALIEARKVIQRYL